jgi:hypothetical protein
MASKIAENLEATWSLVATFTAETSTSSLAEYTAFFEPDAVVYLMGSTAPPAIGREALTTTLQSILTYWGLIERKVLTSVVDEKRRTVANSMSNKLRIGDKILDDFRECEVVTFSERGLVEKYEIYTDPAPIAAILGGGS